MLKNLKTVEMSNQILGSLDYLIKLQVFVALKFEEFGYKMFPFLKNLKS